ncbi:uncharacterized protein LOC123310808 [Coccinella septempunctata]|uniref:uncharacterized protein LOC123310808 n=1 Tax=Coccinella septempunctata TaxID=41139 RepID=UPI001D060666|nr:uncharacterized protein LOC123310808 [Coccinella septempunctata]
MTAPSIQDPREDMLLSCSFYIGDEDLYAVKWYKDDYEFFRYSPKGRKPLLFEVTGVQVDLFNTKCNMSFCYLSMKNLTRSYSSGAYRCEVSIEAPTFRLVSKTQNITVAAIPMEKPVLSNLSNTYLVGDLLDCTCLTAPGDPTPTIAWYVNDKMVNTRYYRSTVKHQTENGTELKKTSSHLRFPLSKKLLGNNSFAHVGITCQQLTILGTPQNSTEIIRLMSEDINNHKFFNFFGSTSSVYRGSITTIIAAIVFVYK